jgi:hypothetical protein
LRRQFYEAHRLLDGLDPTRDAPTLSLLLGRFARSTRD